MIVFFLLCAVIAVHTLANLFQIVYHLPTNNHLFLSATHPDEHPCWITSHLRSSVGWYGLMQIQFSVKEPFPKTRSTQSPGQAIWGLCTPCTSCFSAIKGKAAPTGLRTLPDRGAPPLPLCKLGYWVIFVTWEIKTQSNSGLRNRLSLLFISNTSADRGWWI